MDPLDRIEQKVDKLHDKLDNHLSRIATLEESMTWLKGHVSIVTAIGTAILGWLAIQFFNVKG